MKRKWQVTFRAHLLHGNEYKDEWSIVLFPMILVNTRTYENEQKQIDIEIGWFIFGITITLYGFPIDNF